MAVILIVDDKEKDRFNNMEYLRLYEHNVDFAENGKLALEKLNTSKPDLILLDIYMPVMNGLEFLQTLKNKKILTDYKIVVLSIAADKDDVKRFCSDHKIPLLSTTCTLAERKTLIDKVLAEKDED